MYCKKCGGKLESYASNCAFCGTPVEKYDTNVNYLKEESSRVPKHMSGAKWIGLWMLATIPLIGELIYLILMFKWSRKSNQDLTLRGYAKANLFLILISLLMFIGLAVFLVLNPQIVEKIKEILEAIFE